MKIQGSVQIADSDRELHNHRFASVSGEAIKTSSNNHVHEVKFRTDFYEEHFHEFCGRTSEAIKVGERHIHFLKSITTQNDGHRHKFRLSTFIEDPIGD